MKFEISNILSAFSDQTIGSKVVNSQKLYFDLACALETYDASGDREPGQHFVMLPESAWTAVSAGVGHKTTNSDDYVVRVHRGQATMFLKRELAATVEGLACVVYTREAYLADPDTKQDAVETARIEAGDCTHIIVAVLAFAGPRAPLTPYRLVHNLGGGNNEVDAWTREDILGKAKESKAYWDVWEVVAD